jgi:hypothetical protein
VATLACGGAERPAATPEPAPTVEPSAAAIPTPTATLAATPVPAPTSVARASAAPVTVPRVLATPPPPVAREASPAPVQAPRVTTAQIAAIVAEGESALTGGKLKEAGALFDDALALDSDNARALKGKARLATTLLGLTRTLVPDLASSEGAEGKVKQIDGFDDVEQLNVKRAVRIPGRAELDGPSGHPQPGDSVTVSIFVRNQSKKKKNIKISNVNVHRIVNNKDSLVTVAWSPVEVLPKQRGLVATLTSPWEDDVSTWILSVKLLSENGDIYENRLVWK